MNNKETNKFTLDEITRALEYRVEKANNRLLSAFTGKLVNFGIILCIIPFCIKLAHELRTVEIVALFTLVGLGYMFYHLARIYMLKEKS